MAISVKTIQHSLNIGFLVERQTTAPQMTNARMGMRQDNAQTTT